MANREPDLQFESEYHPRLIVGDGIDRDTIDRTPMERAGWDAFNGDSTPERRSQQGDSDERSSWYERNDRRHQAHLQHQAAERYRENFRRPGYGERYAFSGYDRASGNGRAHYDPDINRGYSDSPEVDTWREGTRFTDREQDYRGGRWNRETHGYHDGDGRAIEYENRRGKHSPRLRESWRRSSYDARNPESREYADYSGGSTEQDYPSEMDTLGTGYMRQYDNGFGRGSFVGIAPKNYKRSDARIEEDICERLTFHPFIDPSNIEIKVVEGEVILTGEVADRRMKRLTEDIAGETPGVRDVNNQIHVGQR
ncbi:MAG TPA: BON domain-containing protein [Candidatus Kapabacteria bacterium]|nr:BON domain-containing protein [Candidatus Kapabacteria bacterium]